MKVIPFEEKYRQDFIDFNTDWIVSNFGFLEEHDKETFEKIDEEMEGGSHDIFCCGRRRGTGNMYGNADEGHNMGDM